MGVRLPHQRDDGELVLDVDVVVELLVEIGDLLDGEVDADLLPLLLQDLGGLDVERQADLDREVEAVGIPRLRQERLGLFGIVLVVGQGRVLVLAPAVRDLAARDLGADFAIAEQRRTRTSAVGPSAVLMPSPDSLTAPAGSIRLAPSTSCRIGISLGSARMTMSALPWRKAEIWVCGSGMMLNCTPSMQG
jgi:hypothetical protein